MAETSAAAHAIETLRKEPGTLVAGAEGAPELAAFGSGEDAESDEEWEDVLLEENARNEPWTELDVDLSSIEIGPLPDEGEGGRSSGGRR